MPTALPAKSAIATKASQPAIAMPRWRVLQRPMRAASEGEWAAMEEEEEVMAQSIAGGVPARHAGAWRRQRGETPPLRVRQG